MKIMKAIIVTASIGVLAAVVGGCTKSESPAGGTAESVARPAIAASADATQAQTLCPIMNLPINKSLYADVGGKRIYVCCRGCIAAITADPGKIIEQMQAAGIHLENAPGARR